MTAALPAHARRQRALAVLLSRQPLTLAEAAAELGISTDDAGHVLRRLPSHGFEVRRIDPFEPEPHWRVLYPKGRVCSAEGCGTILRRTNPSKQCERHGGGFLRLQKAAEAPREQRPAPRPRPRPAPVPRLDGARIREEREHRGLSLRQLAALAGLSSAYLSRIERGQRGLSAELSDRIATAVTEASAPPAAIDGATLRAAREARGLTVRQFAELVGLIAGFVSRLENGRRPVTPETARWLGTRLGAVVQC